MKLNAWVLALGVSAGLCGSAMADVTGKVTLTGKPPAMQDLSPLLNSNPACPHHAGPVYDQTVVTDDKHDLANVVVSIKVADPKKYPAPDKKPLLDQKDCMYTPHVVAVMTGQKLDVKNSDMTLHNVHTLPFDNKQENFAMALPSTKELPGFPTAETFKVKCDIHPWMVAWIRVVDTPFYAVTSADPKKMGTYSINTKGLPDGEYEIVFWHEKYQEKTAKVTIKGGKGEADIAFDAEGKAASAKAPVVHLASAKAELCPDACCEPATSKAVTTVASK